MMNEQCDAVLAELDRISDVPRYLDLRRRLGEVDAATDRGFQDAYRTYWRMNVVRLGDRFYSRYFDWLERLKSEEIGNPDEVIRELALIVDTPDRPSLQFSVATKLLNTIDPRTPVYDSYVCSFYFFVPPPANYSIESRLTTLLAFYAFLRAEYARVVEQGLLKTSIDRFRAHFATGAELDDERVIDLMIWGFVSLLRNGALQDGRVLFE